MDTPSVQRVQRPDTSQETKYFPSHFRIEVFNLVVRSTRFPSFALTFLPQSHAVNRTRAKGVMTPLASQEPRPRSFNKGTYKGRACARERERRKERISGTTCSGPRVNFCSSEVNKTESVYARCVQPEDYSALKSLSLFVLLYSWLKGRGGRSV